MSTLRLSGTHIMGGMKAAEHLAYAIHKPEQGIAQQLEQRLGQDMDQKVEPAQLPS